MEFNIFVSLAGYVNAVFKTISMRTSFTPRSKITTCTALVCTTPDVLGTITRREAAEPVEKELEKGNELVKKSSEDILSPDRTP